MSATPGDEPTRTSLLDVVELVRGVSYKKAEARSQPGPGLVPVIRANNIQDGQLVFDGLVYVPQERISDVQRVRKGDIVIAMSSGSPDIVGKAALARLDWEGGFGAFCGVLRAKPGTNSELLSQFMKSSAYRAAVERVATGTNINNLSRTTLASIDVPTFEPATQEHLAMMLSEVDQHRRSSSGHLSAAVRAIGRFRRVVLAAACSGRLTVDVRQELGPEAVGEEVALPTGWHWRTFGEVCEHVTVGHVGRMVNEYQPEGVPFLRSLNVRELRFDPKDLKFVSRRFHQQLKKSALRPGDIVIVRSGFVGTACVIPDELPEANCSDLLIARPGPELLPWFGAIYVNSPQMKVHVSDVKVGSAQLHFNTRSLQVARVPLPPVEEQREIVRRVAGLLKIAEGLLSRIDATSKAIARGTEAVLGKAFRDELSQLEVS